MAIESVVVLLFVPKEVNNTLEFGGKFEVCSLEDSLNVDCLGHACQVRPRRWLIIQLSDSNH